MLYKLHMIEIDGDFRISWHLMCYRGLDPFHKRVGKGAHTLGSKTAGFGVWDEVPLTEHLLCADTLAPHSKQKLALPRCYYLSEKSWLNGFSKATWLIKGRARIAIQVSCNHTLCSFCVLALLTANLEQQGQQIWNQKTQVCQSATH